MAAWCQAALLRTMVTMAAMASASAMTSEEGVCLQGANQAGDAGCEYTSLLQVRAEVEQERVKRTAADKATEDKEPAENGGPVYLPGVIGSTSLGEHGQLHSQVGQDWLVSSLLGCKEQGYFVDLAANDAVMLSNSLMLERDFGYAGICIEANPRYLPRLQQRRCQVVQAAVGSPAGKKITFELDGVGGGIVGPTMDNKEVEAGSKSSTFTLVSLGEILDHVKAPAVIDYFSLDVEGAESLVMEGFPWDRYTIRVMTVERPQADLKRKLAQHGYTYLRRNSWFHDETWLHSSAWSPNIAESFGQGGGMADACMAKRGHPRPVSLRY